MSPKSVLPYYSLDDIATVEPWRVGETAKMLHWLRQSGQAVPPSWIIPAESFQQAVQGLVAREPMYAEWPNLLWKACELEGYSLQYVANRLRRPAHGLAVDLPLQTLLADIDGAILRLIPSLWFGEAFPTAYLAQMIGSEFCRADPSSLKAAIKKLWVKVLSAQSLAYWGHQSIADGGPEQVGVAVILQVVDSVKLSGTLTVRPNEIVIEAVRGLPKAIAEVYPDSYRGKLPDSPLFSWQAGYQEYSYQPLAADRHTRSLACLETTVLSKTALEIMTADDERALWALAKQLQVLWTRPLQVEWSTVGTTAPPHISQACWWPAAALPSAMTGGEVCPVSGCGASPGTAYGLALVIHPGDPLPTTAEHKVIVTSEVAPDWLPFLKTAAAVISERGGLTCHAAILARELGLPAIIGVTEATRQFSTGDALRVDGDRGLVERLEALPEPSTSSAKPVLANLQIPADSFRPQIWLNLSQPDVAETAAQYPVGGVGLLRSEWLMMPAIGRQHPYRWLENGQGDALVQGLLAQLRPIVKAFSPRPVRYRSLDIRSSEFAQLEGSPPIEANPMLGMRGAFSYQRYPAFFRAELEVLHLLQQEGYDNVQLLLPFVRTVEDVHYCQEYVRAVGLDQSPAFELWIMAEVPSVLFLLEQYVAAGIRGVAIGPHDLTQLILGIDRDQTAFSRYFDEPHPAVKAAIAQVIHQSNALNISSCLCGIAPPHNAEYLKLAIEKGVTSISVDLSAIEATADIIHRIEASTAVD